MRQFLVTVTLSVSLSVSLLQELAYAQPEPGSMVYYDVHSGVPLLDRDFRLRLPGSRRNAHGAEVSTLRGWLRGIPGGQNCDDDPPDTGYVLELDPAWLESKGIDINQVVRVGSIASGAMLYSRNAAVSRPKIKIELMSWHEGQRGTKGEERPVPRPRGWEAITGWELPCTQRPGKINFWPWNPKKASNDPNGLDLRGEEHGDHALGDYVEMTGALVTDWPHGVDWSDQPLDGDSPANPARWTEMHPPDAVERLECRAPTETVRSVALFAANGLFSGDTNEIQFHISPDEHMRNKPYPDSVLDVRVQRGAYLNDRTYVEDIRNLGDHINVKVTVKGESGWGRPGKYQATYRVFWTPTHPYKITVSPSVIPLNQPTAITVNVEDRYCGQLFGQIGTVTVGNQQHTPGQPFQHTFDGPVTGTFTPVWPPGARPISFPITPTLRKLTVSANPARIPLQRPVQIKINAEPSPGGFRFNVKDTINGVDATNVRVFVNGNQVQLTDNGFTFTFESRTKVTCPKHSRNLKRCIPPRHPRSPDELPICGDDPPPIEDPPDCVETEVPPTVQVDTPNSERTTMPLTFGN